MNNISIHDNKRDPIDETYQESAIERSEAMPPGLSPNGKFHYLQEIKCISTAIQPIQAR